MTVAISRRTAALALIMMTTTPAVLLSRAEAADHGSQVSIGLEGYCPVCVVSAHKWEKGKPEINSTYDGITYLFPNQTIKAKFDASPERFVPALGGDCTVCYEKLDKRVPGNIRHAAIHSNRLYLFPSEKERKAFLASPTEFENTDLAANGECVVCRVKAGKHVAGSPKHTVIHKGLRYQFPSEREAAAFRQSPEQFAVKSMAGNNMKVSMKSTRAGGSNSATVKLVGRSGCAGCEHGVTPLSAPDELGLAVNTTDGRVVVIEDAHTLYPNAYAARFEGQRVEVEGMVLKTEGKISWLKPTSLRVIN